jgi:hypothetical protein
MTRFYLTLVLSLSAGVAGIVPWAEAQSIAAASCTKFKDAEEPAQEAPYLSYLRTYGNAGQGLSDAALVEDTKKIREWCGKNAKSTYGEAVATLLGPPQNEVAINTAQGLLRNHLFPSVGSARVHALELTNAREQISKLPNSSKWAMPPIYSWAFHGKQPPPMPDAPNIWFPIGPQPIAAVPSAVWGVTNVQETGRINSIAPTPQGSIYAGAEFGGVWVYSPLHHKHQLRDLFNSHFRFHSKSQLGDEQRAQACKVA